MSLSDQRDVLMLQELGKQYAAQALGFFGEKYSQKPEVGEVALFYATATAALAEAMYAFLNANTEKEQADGWLTQLFSMISQSLNIKSPLPAGLSARAVEASIDPAAAPAMKRPQTACICALDLSGICPTCPGQIKASVRKTLIPIGDCLRSLEQGLRQVGGEKPCATCTDAYLDAAVASVIMEGTLGELSPESAPFADQIYEGIYQWAIGRGVEEMALTEQAWSVFARSMSEQEPDGPDLPPTK